MQDLVDFLPSVMMSNTLLPFWLWFAIIGGALLAKAIYSQRRRKAHLPPGPPPLPIVGNILDVPRVHLGREFADLTKKFGKCAPSCHNDMQRALIRGCLNR